MPIYEYRCSDCEHEFEELVSFSQADQVACIKCGSQNTARLASGFSCSISSGAADGAMAPPCGVSG